MLQTSRKAGQISRTRQRIEAALFALLQEQDLLEISVISLCEVAGVGRQTFYRHFADKEDVIRSRMQRIFDEYLTSLQTEERASWDVEFVNLETLRVWKAHKEFFILTAKPSVQGVIFSEMDRMMDKMVSANLAHSQIDPLLRAFRHWGMKGVLLAWAQSGMRQSPEEINAILKAANDSPRLQTTQTHAG
ncbi:MAG: TetR/AcrR family transcriptional regulator [Pseudomonadota bacterium]